MDAGNQSRAGCACRVMGIVNVTPDSFSDGGECFGDPAAAADRARRLAAEGAAIIDIGGESTRPGATPLEWQEEWRRVRPVLGLLEGSSFAVSVDTYHPETAELALRAGAEIVNCVYADPVPDMLRVISRSPTGAELVVPASCLGTCSGLGDLSRIYLDPMVGFGTTRDEDVALLRSVAKLAGKGRVLVGASRKRIVRALACEEDTGSLVGGDVAIALWAAANGASIVRVHDVREVAQALRVWARLDFPGAGRGCAPAEKHRYNLNGVIPA